MTFSKFSVVIPTIISDINKLDYLVNQILTFSDIIDELIIVNQSVVNYTCPSSSVSIKNVEWRGLSKARNCGADLAKNEYIIFCDDDIKLSYDSLKAVIDFVIKNPEVDCITGAALLESGEKSNVGGFDKESRKILTHTLDKATLETCMVIKRSVFTRHRFNENLGIGTFYGSCEGRDLIRNIVSNGGRAQYLSFFNYYHKKMPLSGFDINKRYFDHGVGLAGYFKFHKDYRFLVSNILRNILASFFYIYSPKKAKKYISKLIGIFAGLVI